MSMRGLCHLGALRRGDTDPGGSTITPAGDIETLSSTYFAPEYSSYVPADDPRNLTLVDNFVYTFVRKDDNATIDIRVKEERSSIMSRVPLRLSPCLLLIFGYTI